MFKILYCWKTCLFPFNVCKEPDVLEEVADMQKSYQWLEQSSIQDRTEALLWEQAQAADPQRQELLAFIQTDNQLVTEQPHIEEVNKEEGAVGIKTSLKLLQKPNKLHTKQRRSSRSRTHVSCSGGSSWLELRWRCADRGVRRRGLAGFYYSGIICEGSDCLWPSILLFISACPPVCVSFDKTEDLPPPVLL